MIDHVDSTGKRRYGHPALNGVLPQPWLPLKKGQSIVNHGRTNGTKPDTEQAVVLTLRKRKSMLQGNRPSTFPSMSSPLRNGRTPQRRGPLDEDQENVEFRPAESHTSNRLSYDPASGVIMLPEDHWLGEESDSDAEYMSSVENQENSNTVSVLPHTRTPTKRHATYYHHPERRRQSIPGAFPR